MHKYFLKKLYEAQNVKNSFYLNPSSPYKDNTGDMYLSFSRYLHIYVHTVFLNKRDYAIHNHKT